MAMFQYFWRFAQICKKFAAFAHKIVFVIVSVVKLFRNNKKNNFASKCCKFLANLCKSSEILEHCHGKWWLKYQNNRSVSWRLSCKFFRWKSWYDFRKISNLISEKIHVDRIFSLRINRPVDMLIRATWAPELRRDNLLHIFEGPTPAYQNSKNLHFSMHVQVWTKEDLCR